MYKTSDFSAYGCCVDEVFDLAQYEDQYYNAPQVTTSGSTLPEFVYNSVEYVHPNSQALYPVLSVPHGGTTFYYYPDVVLVPVYYFVPVAVVYQDPIVYENPCLTEDHLDEIRYDYACNDQHKECGIYDSYDCGYVAEEKVGPEITSFFCYAETEEKLLDAPPPVINDRENDSSVGKKTYINRGIVKDPYEYREFCRTVEERIKKQSASSPEKKTYRAEIQSPVSRDTVEESSAFRKFCSTVEDRRRILNDSSVGKKTYINRGIVKDPSEYREFCRTVEERIKKQSASSPEKKTYRAEIQSPVSRDTVEESSAFRKFCSTVEDRRRILNDSSVVKKTYINRGIVKDPSEYREFCRRIEERIKKQRSTETSPSPRVKEFIAKESSKIGDVIHEGNGKNFMDRILKSAEYLHIQDNITNSKHYRDSLYKQALQNNPRRNQAILFDILPVISEESFIFDDVTAEVSCGDLREIEPQELVSEDGIAKPKQRKGRWKSFRNWWSKKFFCCCSTKDPP